MAIDSLSPNGKRQIEKLETAIEAHLSKLPQDLREPWEKEFADTPDAKLPRLESRLRSFLQERSSVKHEIPPLFPDAEHLIADPSHIDKTLRIVRQAERDPALFVGEGRVARVYKSPLNATICYKVVHNVSAYEQWNSVDKEGRYLEKLENVSVRGVRTPHISGIIDRPDIKVIIMEYLDAKSIEKALADDDQILRDIDATKFFGRLREYIAEMHDKHHIYHRDLHEGNILIGKDGTPYVIDFGCAAISIDPEAAYEGYDKFGHKTHYFISDEQRLASVEKKVNERRHSTAATQLL